MANPYHDFNAEPLQPTGSAALLHGLNALGEAYNAHKQGEQQKQDAIKLFILKSALERQQEQAKQEGEFNMEGKRIERGRQIFPGMFPGQQESAPEATPTSVGVGKPAMTLLNGSQGDVNGNTVNFNPIQANASSEQNKIKNPVGGWDVNPNFAITGKGDMFAKKPDNSLQLQEKQDQFNQREWDKLTKEVNPLTTSGRNPLGMAMKANYNANRALSTLGNPMVTNQEAGNVMADIASIYQNGSPTQFGMSEQAYHTLTAKLSALKQYFTGKPQDALTPDIKNRLLNVLYDMKRTNFDVLKQNLVYAEKAKAKLIKSFPQEWQDMKDTLMSDAYSGLGKQSSGGDMNGKIQKARDAGYSEEEIQKYLQGKM